MSNIKLVHSGGNSVSITAPDSNPASNRTLKLPSDVDGTITTYNSSGNIVPAAGKGIDYSAQTVSSVSGVTVTNEVADHYEEGTFTPVLLHYSGGGFVEPNYSAAGTVAGSYTRVGNICYINGAFLGYNISNAGGSSFGRIGGIPYPAKNQTNLRGVINYSGDAFTTNVVNFATYWGQSFLNSMAIGAGSYDWAVLVGGATKNLTFSGFYFID